MALLIAIFVASVLITIGAGIIAHRRAASVFGGPTVWGTAAARRVGPVPAAILIALGGWAIVVILALPLGFLAKHLERSVDLPVFNWVSPHVSATWLNGLPLTESEFTHLNEKLTNMGANAITQVVCLIALILLACMYKKRWWIPACGIAGAYFSEHYIQKFLAKVVDRGHPPTTLGTFPSGGVGRILAVYGAILILVIILMPTLSRAWRAGLWTGLTTAAVIEAFTRIYLAKHWLTDAVFALPFGALFLLTNVAAISALAYTKTPARRAAAPITVPDPAIAAS